MLPGSETKRDSHSDCYGLRRSWPSPGTCRDRRFCHHGVCGHVSLPTALPPYPTALVPSGRRRRLSRALPIGLLDLDEDLADTFAALGIRPWGSSPRSTGESNRASARRPGAYRLGRGVDARGPSTPRDATLRWSNATSAARRHRRAAAVRAEGALDSLGSALRRPGPSRARGHPRVTLESGARAERAVRPRGRRRTRARCSSLPRRARRLAARRAGRGHPLAATAHRPRRRRAGRPARARGPIPPRSEAAFDRIRRPRRRGRRRIPETRDGHLRGRGGRGRVGRSGVWESGKNGKSGIAGRPAPTLHAPTLPLFRAPPPRNPVARARAPRRSGIEALPPRRDLARRHSLERPRATARAGGAATPATAARDYFTARTSDGTLWLLFRRAVQWHLAGWWD